MKTKEYLVVGITHVDLAWQRGPAEMSEMYEVVITRLLDMLDRYPDFRYMLEQATHLRLLEARRTDLIARIKPYLANGRLELVGAMASTLEVNIPNGESFVRNQSIGLRWVRDHLNNPPVTTGWLIDTFGVHAQMPQILNQFGIARLMANRYGGDNTHDAFFARGLDGTKLFCAGWTTYSGHVRPVNITKAMCYTRDGFDKLKGFAAQLNGPGPFMICPYTENEMLVTPHELEFCRQQTTDNVGQSWRPATPREWFDAVLGANRTWPERHADMNPEFTGCFSLRTPLRVRNRAVENKLLEAEKWSAIAGQHDAREVIEEAWWTLAYVQFHDVFTGSHPTWIYHDVMQKLDQVDATAGDVLKKAFVKLVGPAANENATSYALFNGLPFERSTVVRVPVGNGISGVTDATGAALPFEIDGDHARVRVSLPAVGSTMIRLLAGKARAVAPTVVEHAVIENEFVRLKFDRAFGLAELLWKPTNTVICKNVDLIVAQQDDGSMQIESPHGPEVGWSVGTMNIEQFARSSVDQRVRLSGTFPELNAAGKNQKLSWSAEFTLEKDRAVIGLNVSIDWKGEATRVRLMLPTTLDTSSGIFEIPFGVVTRKPYTPRGNARGEWPAHRFVTIQDSKHGLALSNTGTAGVEIMGGTIYTTLLRAPKVEWVGIPLDALTSDHGHHDYQFTLQPYAGTWADAGVPQAAQELNNPVHILPVNGGTPSTSTSHFSVTPANVVLSSIKSADDGSGAMIVRVYETAGRATRASLRQSFGSKAFESNLVEHKGASVLVSKEVVLLDMKPFEIKTLRLDP